MINTISHLIDVHIYKKNWATNFHKLLRLTDNEIMETFRVNSSFGKWNHHNCLFSVTVAGKQKLSSCCFSDLPKAAVRILSNVTFLFVSLSYTAESAIVTAFITFIPKFIESQFGIPASNASIYTGELRSCWNPFDVCALFLMRTGTGCRRTGTFKQTLDCIFCLIGVLFESGAEEAQSCESTLILKRRLVFEWSGLLGCLAGAVSGLHTKYS